MGKRATIQDIAQKSGYSKTAVSFAFNAPEKISAEARDRILSIARELGYSPDPMARNFSKGRHMAIGFLLPQNPDKALGNPYTQAVIAAIAEGKNESHTEKVGRLQSVSDVYTAGAAPAVWVPVFFHPRQNSRCNPNAAVPEEARKNSLATAGFR